MIIKPKQNLRGEINIPGDKSISHRSVIFGSLAVGITEIDGFLMGEDCLSTIDCFRKMGVEIEVLDNNRVIVKGNGLNGLKSPKGLLYTGNSGTTTRLLLGILAGQPFSSRVTGDASIEKRPMGRVTKPLQKMGAKIAGIKDITGIISDKSGIISDSQANINSGLQNADYCPLEVSPAKLHGITYRMPVASAQVKSALLLASLYAEGESVIIENEKSRDHTELMLNYFGGNLTVDGNSITNRPIKELYGQKLTVPGDISSAAFFITAGLITPGSDLIVRNVGINPTRTGILDVYRDMGAKIEILNARSSGNEPVADIRVTASSLKGTVVEGSLIPRLIDEIPVIAVAAANSSGTTIIRDAAELKVKESNRIQTIVSELKKMGADVTETEDGMIIEGGKQLKGEAPLNGAVIDSHHDHRIAMSMAVAGLNAYGETKIEGAEIVNISFPGFYEMLRGM